MTFNMIKTLHQRLTIKKMYKTTKKPNLPAIPVLKRLNQKVCEAEDSLNYKSPSQINKRGEKKNKW